MTVRLSAVDLVRRTAVVMVLDDGRDEFPHVLRGTLAGLFDEPTWHVVVALEDDGPQSRAVSDVLDQARRWASERDCRFSVTPLREVAALTRGETAP